MQLKKHTYPDTNIKISTEHPYESSFCLFNYSSPIQTLTVGSGITPDQPCYQLITQVTGLRHFYLFTVDWEFHPTPEE